MKSREQIAMEALTEARVAIVERRPALTLSRTSTVNTYLSLLGNIDGAIAALSAPPAQGSIDAPHLSDIEHPMQHACPDDPQPIGAHHLTPESIAATIQDLQEIEDGTTERPWEGRDWRTQAGVWHHIMLHLADRAARQSAAPGGIRNDMEFVRLICDYNSARADDSRGDVWPEYSALCAYIDARIAPAPSELVPQCQCPSCQSEGGLLPCPFCGGTNIDPAEWSDSDDKSGPGCGDCGALADSAEQWNRRAATTATSGGEAVALGYISNGVIEHALEQGFGATAYIQVMPTNDFPVPIYFAPPPLPATDAASVLEEVREGSHILANLIESIEKHGNYSQEAMITFLGQVRHSFSAIRALISKEDGHGN